MQWHYGLLLHSIASWTAIRNNMIREYLILYPQKDATALEQSGPHEAGGVVNQSIHNRVKGRP